MSESIFMSANEAQKSAKAYQKLNREKAIRREFDNARASIYAAVMCGGRSKFLEFHKDQFIYVPLKWYQRLLKWNAVPEIAGIEPGTVAAQIFTALQAQGYKVSMRRDAYGTPGIQVEW